MITSFYWVPVVKREGSGISERLEQILTKKYGSLDSTKLDDGDLDYLEGLSDGGVKGAYELMEAIETHGAIELKEI